MPTHRPRIRNAGSAVSATALMTLAVIAATASATPTATAAQVEATAVWMEHSAMRTMAAAVAAAARDLLSNERDAAAHAPVEPLLDSAPDSPRVIQPRSSRTLPRVPLREAMLALPPPAR